MPDTPDFTRRAGFEPLVKIAILIGGADDGGGLSGAARALDRRLGAGPARAEPRRRRWGCLQPLADGLKFIFKEEYTPAHVDQVPVHPGPDRDSGRRPGDLCRHSVRQRSAAARLHEYGIKDPIELVVAPGVDVGLVYVFALSSIAVYGVILGGWASNSKYSFLGGLRQQRPIDRLRDSARPGHPGSGALQRLVGSRPIIADQATTRRLERVHPAAWVLWCSWSLRSPNRPGLPFDLPECEQELIGGYHTEYAGMKLLLFLIAEFLHMVVVGVLDRDPVFRRLAFVGRDRLGRRSRRGSRRSCGSWCWWPRSWRRSCSS